jgi:hypothetical protein
MNEESAMQNDNTRTKTANKFSDNTETLKHLKGKIKKTFTKKLRTD